MRPSLLRARARVTLAVGVGALALLAGCATSMGTGAGGSGTGSATAPIATVPSMPMQPVPTGSTPPVGVPLIVQGTVVEGAEPACLILQTANGQYELLGTSGVHVGDKVQVSGSVVHVMSHCMQGRPFKVTTLRHL